MSRYADALHPPNADHKGELPRTDIDDGPSAIIVTLDTWGPQDDLFTSMYDALTATWGDYANRSATQACDGSDAWIDHHIHSWEHKTGWCRLTDNQRAYVERAFAGQTLQQILELITFKFTVQNVTRAFTHEFVRARIGSGFMQHGGRDNDWRHRNWTMPETMRRMIDADDKRDAEGNRPVIMNLTEDSPGKRVCIEDWSPIDEYLRLFNGGHVGADIEMAIIDHVANGKALYAAMVDAGIPWQDARRVLPIGTQTYIHGLFNYVAVKGLLANRLEHGMDWEMNCVAQLMLREIKMKCPMLISKFLGSHSDLAQRAMFERLQFGPPDGKYPSTVLRCAKCGHAEANHRKALMPIGINEIRDERVCEVCQRSGCWAGVEESVQNGRNIVPPMHVFVAEDTLPRVHRREQLPFWVLSPASMAGGPIEWLWTNGHYHDIDSQLPKEEV